MRDSVSRLLALIAISLAPLMLCQAAAADSQSFKQLTAEWWQWALSIPASQNPMLDGTGAHCMEGQRGDLWFLAGTFGGGAATRSCAVPEGASLFFPVANSVFVDSPNVCGQGPESTPIKDERAAVKAAIDVVTDVSATLNGQPIRHIRRVQSVVFAVALPEENVFDAFCPPPGVPAGIYSPAVDDGYYVHLTPLEVGTHTLRLHAANPPLDVTYNLTVVPIVLAEQHHP